MKEAILHIGIHKTGSSSIQKFLADFDDGETFYSRIAVNHSVPLFTIFSRKSEEYHLWKRKGLSKRQVDRKKAQYLSLLTWELNRKDRKRIILSGEDVSILNQGEKKDLVDFIKSFGIDLKVICYVREPVSFCASLFQEDLKDGRSEFAAYPMSYPFRLGGFSDLLRASDVIVRDFATAHLVGGDVVRDFLHQLDLSAPLGKVPRHNESLSAQAAKLLYFGNNLPVPETTGPKRRAIRRRFISTVDHLYEGRPPLDRSRFSGLIDFKEEDRHFLGESFGIWYDIPADGDADAWKSYMQDQSDIDPAPLLGALEDLGVRTTTPASARDLATILFYAMALAETGAPQTARGRTLGALVDRLPLIRRMHAELSFLKFFWSYRLGTMRRGWKSAIAAVRP